MSHRLIYMTATNRAAAAAIARQLVEEQLIACANILDGVLSIYRWEGRIVEDHEAVMIAKTRTECAPRVIARIRELHDYTTPCAVAVAITHGDAGFLEWVSQSCSD